MNLRTFFLLLVAVSLLTFSCQEDAKDPDQADATTDVQTPTADSIQLTTEAEKPPIITGIADNPNRFPGLKAHNDSTTEFHAYDIRFFLTHQYPLVPITDDNIPWINENGSNEQMGMFLHYILEGRELNMGEPNIRVDYMAKSNRGYPSIDSAFYSIQSYFMADATASQVLKERHAVPTAYSGMPMEVMEIFGVRGGSFTSKYVAQAFYDYDANYIVSIRLEAIEENKYQDALPAFYHLVKNFNLKM